MLSSDLLETKQNVIHRYFKRKHDWKSTKNCKLNDLNPLQDYQCNLKSLYSALFEFLYLRHQREKNECLLKRIGNKLIFNVKIYKRRKERGITSFFLSWKNYQLSNTYETNAKQNYFHNHPNELQIHSTTKIHFLVKKHVTVLWSPSLQIQIIFLWYKLLKIFLRGI